MEDDEVEQEGRGGASHTQLQSQPTHIILFTGPTQVEEELS